MQVSVETLSDLERRVTVQVPADQVTGEINSRLQKLSRQVKVHGFRPGKVPLKLIKKLHGDQVRYEVANELMQHSLIEALMQERLNPVGAPTIEPKNFVEGQDFEYCATFEILPEFEPSGFENIQVEQPIAEVTEQDIDAMIETLRRQRTLQSVVGRPARTGDRVLIDFHGQIEGQDFPGGKGENVSVVLGNSLMPKDFEDQLVGLGARAETAFDLTFPENYQAREVAGKTAHFRLKVNTVEEVSLPELDDAFAASFDIKEGGVTSLRQSLRVNMERELRDGIKAAVKRQVLQGLLATNPILLPQTLVNAEIESLAGQLRFQDDAQNEKIQQLKTQLFSAEAQRRVAIGLLMSRVAKVQDIKVDEQRVQEHLATMAASYEEPAAVISSCQQDPETMANIRALVAEDQVVEWLLERVQVTQKPSTFTEVVTPSPSQVESAAQQQPSAQESAA